jgi:membrane associated rhomboid family serine protease
MPEVADEAWVEVGRFDSAREAGERALVLVAAGVDCLLAPGGSATTLLVRQSAEAEALSELATYDDENRHGSAPPADVLPLRDGLTGVLAYSCILVFVYSAAVRHAFGKDWFAAGEAQAGLILGGEWERVVTGLTLHADFGHLLSNLIAGSVFGLFVSQMLGSGFAWLMILVAGSVGNAVNAFLQQSSHTSVGASTAIFGAIGLLAVVALRHRARWRAGLRKWIPLAAGLMLLAFLGIEGERVDVGAHLAGFAAGALLGAGILAAGPPRPTARSTAAFVIFALAVVLGSWGIALAHIGD